MRINKNTEVKYPAPWDEKKEPVADIKFYYEKKINWNKEVGGKSFSDLLKPPLKDFGNKKVTNPSNKKEEVKITIKGGNAPFLVAKKRQKTASWVVFLAVMLIMTKAMTAEKTSFN